MNNRAENSHLPFHTERNTAHWQAYAQSQYRSFLNRDDLRCRQPLRTSSQRTGPGSKQDSKSWSWVNGTGVDRAPPTAIAVSRVDFVGHFEQMRACRHQSKNLHYDCTKTSPSARSRVLCCATNRMRTRIASPENVPQTSSVASPCVFPLPHWSPPEPQLPFQILNQCLSILALWSCGRRGSVVQAQRQIHRALCTAIPGTVVRAIAAQVQLAALIRKPGSAVVVPNTIWWAASRRHSFRRRCRVRSC